MKPKSSLNRSAFRALLAVGLITVTAGVAEAQQRSFAQRLSNRVPFDRTGALLVENPLGALNIVGTTDEMLDITANWVVTGVDDAAIAEGRRQTQILLGGTSQNRILRSVVVQPPRDGRWSVSVSYFVKVPRSVHVTAWSRSGEGINISGITGNVNVKTMSGPIHLNSVLGLIRADSVNGNIHATYTLAPTVNAVLSTVNGHVIVTTPRNASFTWHAETLKGDFLTALPLRGAFSRRSGSIVYRGIMNEGTMPVIQTMTMTGRVTLASPETQNATPRSLIASAPGQDRQVIAHEDVTPSLQRVSDTLLVQPPSAKTFVAQRNLIDGNFRFETSLGNIFLGEVRGNADITTQAGEIILGRVAGSCKVTSMGGPLNLGDISGVLTARTAAGDIHVRAARKGGAASTDGGNVHVVHAGGPITLTSGGGDITLQNALSSVRAETRSGDINITLDGSVRTESIQGRSVRGNIVLNVPQGFAADVEITIMTSSDMANRIHSQLPGLSIIRDQVGARTRIRGVGQINGGGRKVELFVEEGDVHLRSGPAPRMVVMPPRQ